MTGKRIRVAVLFGGVSSEHEVSLMSVESVLANLPQEYEVLRIGITKDGRWVEYTGKNDEITSGAWEQDKSLRTAVLSPDRSHKGFLLLGSDGWELAPVDICFPVLHGKHGEDGTIQSLLEFLGIPFVGSPASVCHRAWNKDALHSSLAKYRDLTGEEGCASWPQGVYLARDAFKGMGAATALDMVADRVIGGYPVCVKPAHGGSALGIHKVESQEELGEAVLDALSYDEAVNIEQWVDGVELSVSILGTGWDAHALPPVEIVAREGFYDATARMADDAVEFFCPVRDESLSPNAADAQAIRAEIERAALEVYRAYSVRDLGRVDLIWDGGAARCFEVDVSPGMTERSLFPMACAAAGLSLPAVLDSLVNEAYARGACF